MVELANCSRCNKVFIKSVRSICQECYEKEEEAFRAVYIYLKEPENRQATMIDIAEDTGVEEELIYKFVREGRLLPAEYPMLSYPCERCQAPIQAGRYCIDCIKEMKEDLERHEKEQAKEEKKEHQNIYVTFNKNELKK